MLQRGTTWVAESLSPPPNASWFRPFSPTPVTPQRCQSAALTRAGRFVLLQDRKPTQEGSAQQCVRLGVALTPAPMVTFLLIPPRAQRGQRSQKSLLYSAEIITCNKMRLDLERYSGLRCSILTALRSQTRISATSSPHLLTTALPTFPGAVEIKQATDCKRRG